MNFNKLKGKLREKELTQEKMARELGITVQSLNAKLNGRTQFTLEEVVSISNLLDIRDPVEIFFENQIPNTQQKRTFN